MAYAMGAILVCSMHKVKCFTSLPGIPFLNFLEPMANCVYNYFCSSQRRADPMVYSDHILR